MFRAACKSRPRSELLEPAGPAEAAAGQPATSHSMGDLLTLPKQTVCQDIAQPGAIPFQRFVNTSFYRNQLDRGFPRIDLEEYHSTWQDPFSVLHQRSAYPAAYPVDEREYLYRPSTPTVSPIRLSKPRTPLYCPLISITSDNAVSSVVYQDESDESDDRIVEEDEGIAEQGEVAAGNSNYSVDTVNPFERITTPPEEYAEPITESKRLSLTFDKNFFDTIPYIDQTDDTNLAEASECVQETSCNFNLKDIQKHTDVNRKNQCTLNVAEPNFELDIRSQLYSPPNKSMLSVKNEIFTSDSVTKSNQDDFSYLQGAEHKLSINEQYEDKMDDVSNSEDCADESSSTINDDFTLNRANRSTESGISTPKMYTIMPELHLDLSGLNSDVSSDEPKTEKCWKSPEEVRLGCGRVAALAKHFSKLGDAGLIRFKSTKLTDSRQFVSEPDIMTPEKSNEHLGKEPWRVKEYKSDSDLTRETDGDSRIGSAAGRNVILVDVETGGNFAIHECRLHHCGAKQVTIAKFPSLNDGREQIAISTEKSVGLTEIEDYNDVLNHEINDHVVGMEDHMVVTDNNESQILGNHKNALAKHISMKDNSKLSLEEQQVIVEQLEQFSNLDNADAPLFIPERSMEQASLKDENNEASAFDTFTRSTVTDPSETMPREKLSSLVNTDNNSQRTKQDEASGFSSSSSSPLASVHSPSSSHSSVVLSLSSAAKNSLSSEDSKLQTRQHCGKHSKPCLLIDISHASAQNRSNDSSLESPSMLPPGASMCDNKRNILCVRIARPLCGSEDNLIGATICDKEKVDQAADCCSESAKLTRSCENILSSKFLLDSTERKRSSGCLQKDVDSLHRSCNKVDSEFKEKTHWYRHRSLEELKSKRGSRKQDNYTLVGTTKVQRFSRSAGNRSALEDKEETRRSRCQSLEELKSKKESREQYRPTSAAEIQKPDWVPKRLRKKHVIYDRIKGNALELSRDSKTEDEEPHKWRVERKSQSELDVSRWKPEKDGWSFREISSPKDDDRFALRKQPHHTTCYALNVRLVDLFSFSLALPE